VVDYKNNLRITDEEISRRLPQFPSGIFSPECYRQSLNDMPTDLLPIIEGIRLGMPDYGPELLEEKPRVMWIIRDEHSHVLWKAIYKFLDEDRALNIVADTTSGKFLEVEEMLYPYTWQLGLPNVDF
jgi:hypothetical protein